MSDLEILNYNSYVNIQTDTDTSNSIEIDENVLISLKQLNLRLGNTDNLSVSNYITNKVGTGQRIKEVEIGSSYKEDEILIYKKEEIIAKQTNIKATLYLCITDNTLNSIEDLNDTLKYINIGSINNEYITTEELNTILQKYIILDNLINSTITKYNPDNIYNQKSVVYKFNMSNEFELYYAIQEVPVSTDIANTDYWKKINFKVDKASIDSLGTVKPDGITIKIKEDGTIYTEVDFSNYYTKEEIDEKIKIVDEVKEYNTGISINSKDLIIYNKKLYIASIDIEQTTNWETDSVNFAEFSINVDLSNYYTKEETDNKIKESINNIQVNDNTSYVISKFENKVYTKNQIVFDTTGDVFNLYRCKIDTTNETPSLETDFEKIDYVTKQELDNAIYDYDNTIHLKVIQRYNPDIDYNVINTIVYRLSSENLFELYRVKKAGMPIGTQVTDTNYWEKITIGNSNSGETGGSTGGSETVTNSFIKELQPSTSYDTGTVVYYKGIFYTVLNSVTTSTDLDSDVKVTTDFRKETINPSELKDLEFDPLYCHDSTKTYTEGTLVFDKETLYIYKAVVTVVPVGTEITNASYWKKVGSISGKANVSVNGISPDSNGDIKIINDTESSDNTTYSSKYIDSTLEPILEGIKTINVLDTQDDITEYNVNDYLQSQNCKTVLSHYVIIQNKSIKEPTEDEIYTNTVTFTSNAVAMDILLKKDEVQRYELHSKNVVLTSTDNIKIIYEATIIPL